MAVVSVLLGYGTEAYNRSENLKIADLTLYLLSRLGPAQNCPKSTSRIANSSFFMLLGMLLAAEP